MKTTIITFVLLILALAATSTAGEITLKKNVFTGWKYSTDGENFKRVGMSGKSLSEIMAGNDAAVVEMNKYRNRSEWATIFAWPGGFMLGWACVSALTDNWKDYDNYLLGAGVVMVSLSTFFEGSATRHLKEAVSIYNGEDQALMFDLIYRKSTLTENGQLTLTLSYTF